MNSILFWCGAAIVCSITLALCICIVGVTLIEIRKQFKKEKFTRLDTPPSHPNCRHSIYPVHKDSDEE
ncbi:hypothetical protein [Enterococcus sp. AZ103]|uniref:hypothetical protein n=1 Tax=Enterococcus sp. AZ103 TaxID=2774628 RepID=UPI003F252564